MIVSDLIKSEVEYLVEQCNFTNDELEVFKRRTKGRTLTSIAYELNISNETCARISQKINKKIRKVITKE